MPRKFVFNGGSKRCNHLLQRSGWSRWLACVAAVLCAAALHGFCADPFDPLLEVMIKNGLITSEEAAKIKAEAEAIRTNDVAMSRMDSKWKINQAVKRLELYGDVRLRYEFRDANTPTGARYELDRGRMAVRLGLRGDLLDNVYFGLRLETSSNPRSPWVTLGNSSPNPFGKSGEGVNVGQAYIGWRQGEWLDLTAGKMPNPLYTTPMVWDPDLNPEGAAERFKYTVGHADFFANFGQFLYQDNNPDYISGSLLYSGAAGSNRTETNTSPTFLLAYGGGVNYNFTKDISAKVGANLYQYLGLVTNLNGSGIGDSFIGEGSYLGATNSPAPVNGLTTQNGISFNQVGIDNLLVLEIPFELNFNFDRISTRVFGDYGYNLDGAQRAIAARKALAAVVQQNPEWAPYKPPMLNYPAQTGDVHAYQIGLAVGSRDRLGLVNGTTSKKNAWELRGYWQHVEQYALDPNLVDSDYFEGRGNLQGVYAALAYSVTDNLIFTARYGYAWRINSKLGTGGSNLDIPQINPIDHYSILQLDMTLRF